jgi:Helicase HerA, central domain
VRASDYEKLGAFYLGSRSEPGRQGQPLVYDAKDLTTHGLCVGMTGSGKTGLCLSLLEEAAIDGVPVIAIDPKGDLGNLLLTFPELRPEDFAPWIDDAEATRHGRTVDEHARATAAKWRKGLLDSGQDPSRITRLREAVELAIYTPGSQTGRPLSVLRSLTAPSAEVAADPDALRDRVAGAVSGLCALLGLDPDPVRSREHVLLSNLLDHAWRQGTDLDLGALVGQVLEPPMERVGVMDLETFFPAKARQNLAMQLNNLLASPSFAGWLEGEPLDIAALLRTPSGKPRVSILSIAHLSDTERMFFVTLLLGELIAWMRGQSGTSSLRALLYMDEVFGFFPPVAEPPSKRPMLTLLKQARAYGVGVLLATQNPVDLDYKGLSNCGTWLLGRLSTQRDVNRVLDGLEGAAQTSGVPFDRQATATLLAGLEPRNFYMRNVHDDGPALFRTRWALSYLRGPMTTAQIKKLVVPTEAERAAPEVSPAQFARGAAPVVAAATATATQAKRAAPKAPPLDDSIEQLFVAGAPEAELMPALLAEVTLHYSHRYSNLDRWLEPTLIVPLPTRGRGQPTWTRATWHQVEQLQLHGAPAEGARFVPIDASAFDKKRWAQLPKQLKSHLAVHESMPVWYCPSLKLWSSYGESEAELVARAQQQMREKRDLSIEKLRAKYAPKIKRLEERLRKANQKIERQQSDKSYAAFDTAVNVGGTVVGAIFGRSAFGGAKSSIKSVGRTVREGGDVKRAQQDAVVLKQDLLDLDAQFEDDVSALEDRSLDAPVERRDVKPKKSDIQVLRLALVWLPATSPGTQSS